MSNSDESKKCYYNATKKKQLEVTLYLKEASSRLIDLSKELNHIYQVFSDDNFSKREKKALLYSINNIRIPYLIDTSKKIASSSTTVAPIVSTVYIHNQNKLKF